MLKIEYLQIILIILIFFLSGCNSVVNTNQPPEITSIPITIATVGEQYTYQIIVKDPDNEELSHSLLAYPTGMQINASTGLIQWIPNQNQVKTYIIEIEVSDGELFDIQQFNIIVSE